MWLPAQLMNFYFLSPAIRCLYVAVLTFSWTNVLSYVKHTDCRRIKQSMATNFSVGSERTSVLLKALLSGKDKKCVTNEGDNDDSRLIHIIPRCSCHPACDRKSLLQKDTTDGATEDFETKQSHSAESDSPSTAT